MRTSLQLKSTSDEGLQKVQGLSCYQAYLVQLSLRMHELLGKKVAFFATPFARDRSLEVVVRNFVHSARKSQKEFSGFLSGALNEFVDRYFREMLLLTYLSLAGNLAWALTTLLCSVFAFQQMREVSRSVFLCQDHEISEKQKMLDRLLHVVQVHKNDNYFYMTRLREADIAVDSLEERGAYKAVIQKGAKQHRFGVAQLAGVLLAVPLLLVGLNGLNIRQYVANAGLLRSFDDLVLAAVRTQESAVEHTTVLVHYFLFQDTLALPGDAFEPILASLRDLDATTDELIQHNIRLTQTASIAEESLQEFVRQLISRDQCTFLEGLSQFEAACRSIDKKVASEGYLQTFFRYRDQLSGMHNLASKYPPAAELASFLGDQTFAEFEFMSEAVYNEVFRQLVARVLAKTQLFCTTVLFRWNQVWDLATSLIINVQPVFSVYCLLQLRLRMVDVVFLFRLVPMRSVLENLTLLNTFLAVFKKKRRYFS